MNFKKNEFFFLKKTKQKDGDILKKGKKIM